jgi:hypothetical protein
LITDNVNAYGVYAGGAGCRIDGLTCLRVGKGGSAIPAIAASALNVGIANCTFIDDQGTPISTLAIRVYPGATALIGPQVYSTGISTFVYNVGGTVLRGSEIRNSVPGSPTAGTFEAGAFCLDSNGAFTRCSAAGTPGTWVTI